MKYIIDRFEGKYAVCEDESGSMHNIERERIAPGAAEGDTIFESAGSFIVDSKETEARRKRIEEKRRLIWGK